MTYGEVLARFTELCATGARRALRRRRLGPPELARAGAGAVPALRGAAAPLDAARRRSAGARASSTIRRRAWGVLRRSPPPRRRCCIPPTRSSSSRCATGPGKPVPFVPVLDGEVRRWYMADALWQAQDDRLGVDEVFVIPGPRSGGRHHPRRRAGRRAAGALRGGGDRAGGGWRRGGAPRRLADPGPAPAPLASIAGRRARRRALRRAVRGRRGRRARCRTRCGGSSCLVTRSTSSAT